MASLRNAMKRRTHKERHQPAKRAKRFGLLEKKRDYVVRARDYRRKQGRLRLLKAKAEARNPDEFYFGMVHTRTKQGVFDAGTQAALDAGRITSAHMKLMRSQDVSYVRMKAGVERKKIERLSAGLHFLPERAEEEEDGDEGEEGEEGGYFDEEASSSSSSRAKPKHTIFVDSKEECDDFDAAEYFDTLPEYVGRTFNRGRLGTRDGKKVKRRVGDEEEEEDILDRLDDLEDELALGLDEDGKDGGSSSSNGNAQRRRDRARKKNSLIKVHGYIDGKSVRRMRKKRDRAYQELGERLHRETVLNGVALEMDVKKQLLGKGRRVKLNAKAGGANGGKRFYRWKKERKR
jgi:hypothetical protein